MVLDAPDVAVLTRFYSELEGFSGLQANSINLSDLQIDTASRDG